MKITNAKTTKVYELSEEMKQIVKATQLQMKAICDGMGAGVAVTNAYCMHIALSDFLNEVVKENDNKSIEELLQLKEVDVDAIEQ